MKALQIKNLKKIYHNRQQALNGIDLDVEEGDFFALLGPNGAGKSTTIGIITSLVNKTEGAIKVFGLSLDDHAVKIKSLIGVAPQEINFSLFESPLEILINQGGYYGIPRKLAYPRAEKYLRELGLWRKRNDTAGSLSGGLKRRLMIARALIHEPKLLVLDEPTAGVDVELRRSMWHFLMGINQRGTTIVLTTHYLEEAEHLCQKVAIIDHGNIIENTSIKSLLAKLDVETFVLDASAPLPEKLVINNYVWHKLDANSFTVEVPRQQGLNDLFAKLSAQGVKIISMRNKSNRLEELFIDLLDKTESRNFPYANKVPDRF